MKVFVGWPSVFCVGAGAQNMSRDPIFEKKNIKKCYHIFSECLTTSNCYKIISVHFKAVFKTKKAILAVCRNKIRERQLSISTKY